MKYGIVVFKESNNIGDDIQSYAAAQLLPQVDYYIEREYMDVFRPKEDEPVNVIMNGWFMYNKLGWPVSSYINPLYLSMHFCEYDALGIEGDFLDGIGGDDFREHQPIGCRDHATQQFLQKKGIQTWFSGCMTLTLDAKFPKTQGEYICLTNLDEETEHYIRQAYPSLEIRVISQEKTEAEMEKSWEERFEDVEKLLTVYQNAKAVVTTRLHCALPCLALQTPVLLLSQSEIEEQERFDGLGSLVHHAAKEDLLAGKFAYDLNNPPSNPEEYQQIRRTLKETVRTFLEKNSVCTDALKQRMKRYDTQWEQRAVWKNQQLIRAVDHVNERWSQCHAQMEQLTQGKDWLEGQYKALKAQNLEMQGTIETWTNDYKALKTYTDELQTGKDWLEQQYTVLCRENEEKAEQIAALEEKKSSLCSQIQNLEEKLQREEEKLEQVHEELDQAHGELETMKNSYSWKIGRALTAVPRKIAAWRAKK